MMMVLMVTRLISRTNNFKTTNIMKKILFAAAAFVAMASCATDDVVSRPADEVIDFAEAFVENSTRANDIKKDNLSQFNVYGSVNANGTNGFIFTDQEVNKSGDAYTYSPAQYWVPSAGYKFSAFASLTSAQTATRQWSFTQGANAANGTISFNNEAAEANQDLVYAYEALQTAASITAKPDPVAFTFNHMLSRVMFTITNGFTAGSNIKLDITNLTIINAHSNGTLAIVDGAPQTWAVSTDVFARNFGSTTQLADNNTKWTTEHFYLIPAQAEYNVAFDVTLWQAGVEVATYHRTATVALDMEKGKSYNIMAALNTTNTAEDGSEIYPIEFTVEDVNAWENFGDVNATVSTPVSTAAELKEAIAARQPVALAADINLTESLVINGLTAVIDLNGHDIIAETTDAIVIEGNANLTINGDGDVKAATNDASSANALWVKYGNVVINGGNYYVGADNALRNDCIYLGASANKNDAANYPSSIVINGGTFETKVAENGQYWVLNVQDDFYRAGSTIVVNGGSFKNFDPANNLSEGANTNFLAAGKTSTQNAEGWYVVE